MNLRALRLCALAATATAACNGDQHPPSSPAGLEWHLAAAGAQVAARVDGRPIPVSFVQARARETGQDLGRALTLSVDEELLVQEALKRRLQHTPPIRRLVRRVLVNRLLKVRFVDHHGKERIPASAVERAYELNRLRFDRPELVQVSHILASTDKDSTPGQQRAAHAAAKLARRLALGASHTPETFRALKQAVTREYPAARVMAESIVTPRHGKVVEPFAAAAFALENKGEVSEVVATRFGYHVIYLEDREEEVRRSVAQADPEIRDLIYDEVRTEEVETLLAQLRDRTSIARFPHNLPQSGNTD